MPSTCTGSESGFDGGNRAVVLGFQQPVKEGGLVTFLAGASNTGVTLFV